MNLRDQKITKLHFQILDLNDKAIVTLDELKRAYRSKALFWHPDKNPGKETEAVKGFIAVQNAYELLKLSLESGWSGFLQPEVQSHVKEKPEFTGSEPAKANPQKTQAYNPPKGQARAKGFPDSKSWRLNHETRAERNARHETIYKKAKVRESFTGSPEPEFIRKCVRRLMSLGAIFSIALFISLRLLWPEFSMRQTVLSLAFLPLGLSLISLTVLIPWLSMRAYVYGEGFIGQGIRIRGKLVYLKVISLSRIRSIRSYKLFGFHIVRIVVITSEGRSTCNIIGISSFELGRMRYLVNDGLF